MGMGIPSGLVPYADIFGGMTTNNPYEPKTIANNPETQQLESAPIQPTPPAVDPGVVPDQAEVPAGNEFSNDFNQAAIDQEKLRRDVMPTFQGSGPGNVVQGEGSNYFPLGGPEGKDLFNEATVEAPGRYTKAIRAQGDLAEERSNELVKSYDAHGKEIANQVALNRDNANNREYLMQQKLAEMNQATQRYTNDLSDNGKFWSNPGNIISAIGAAFIGFAARDPEAGMRIINNQVQADWQKRRQVADMHLGELRSNLGAYRQLMGDREKGDQLALAESYRVAADDIRRIGTQFAGKEAKAQAEAMAAQADMKSAILSMDLYNKAVYNAPKAMPQPIAGAYKASGQAFPGVGTTSYTQYPGAQGQAPKSSDSVRPNPAPAWLQKEMGDNPNPSSNPNPNPIPPPSGPAPRPVNDAMRTAIGKPTPIDKIVDTDYESRGYNKRAPGSANLVSMVKNRLAEETMAAVGSRGTPDQLNRKAHELYAAAEKEANDMGKLGAEKSAGKLKGWGAFNSDVAQVEAASKLYGKNPNEFLGLMRNMTPASFVQWTNSVRQKIASTDSAAAKNAKDQLDAAIRFQQLVGGKVVDYYHGKFGGAMSEQEIGLGKNVISNDASFEQIKGFGQQQAREAGQEWTQIVGTGTTLPALILQIRYGTESPRINSPGITRNGR